MIWRVGDVAVCVATGEWVAFRRLLIFRIRRHGPAYRQTLRVVKAITDASGTWLYFPQWQTWFNARCFRPVQPAEQPFAQAMRDLKSPIHGEPCV